MTVTSRKKVVKAQFSKLELFFLVKTMYFCELQLFWDILLLQKFLLPSSLLSPTPHHGKIGLTYKLTFILSVIWFLFGHLSNYRKQLSTLSDLLETYPTREYFISIFWYFAITGFYCNHRCQPLFVCFQSNIGVWWSNLFVSAGPLRDSLLVRDTV